MKVELFPGLFLLVSLSLVPACKEESKPAPSAAPTAPAPTPSAPAAAVPAVPAELTVPPPWSTRRVAGSGFPCAVEEVLAASCRRCHWDPRENDAPFSLLRWQDTQKIRTGKPIYLLMQQMVSTDLMPPLDALVEPAVTPLSVEHKQTLLNWLKAGAKESKEVCKP